mmetsp:Transcript_16120/g.28625  ORF Transcript_16120/g.28625 Transcript_16120/m.28625 type:complete len:460 (+) Transcript_16120:430-1809(+)
MGQEKGTEDVPNLNRDFATKPELSKLINESRVAKTLKVPFSKESKGVSVGFLVALTHTLNLWEWSTARVVKEVIIPYTAPFRNCRMVDLPSVKPFTGKADQFVSHPRAAKWGDLVMACADGSETNRIVWIDVFALNQHPGKGLADPISGLSKLIKSCKQGTLLVWDPRLSKANKACNPGLRTWCLYEIFLTISLERPLLIKFGNQKPKGAGWHPSNDIKMVTSLIYRTRLQDSECSEGNDRARLMREIEQAELSSSFNELIRKVLFRNWRLARLAGVQDAVYGNKEKVRAILRKYDPLKDAGDPGGSLLHDLLQGGYVDAAKLAIELGCDVNASTVKGITPLMVAAEGGSTAAVDLLVMNGAWIDLQNDTGESALHLAATYGHANVVLHLLRFGAESDLRNNALFSAADLAEHNHQPGGSDCLALLLATDVEAIATMLDVERRNGKSSRFRGSGSCKTQ